ncbi:ABC transporter substrate-binding protein [Erysipelothrix piscisicarius]|uniref:ABC transporter substrate-binding protein n=1 Tax=Erysipelothrix piscisicarius TaxID=2485784 RepID=UPI002F93CC18
MSEEHQAIHVEENANDKKEKQRLVKNPKENKSVIIGVIAVLLLAVFSTSFFFLNSRCTVDGKSVCYDKDNEYFSIEENASLTVQVENKELGDYLVSTWNEIHPQHKDAISYVVQEPLSIDQMAKGLPYDVMVTSQKNAVYFLDQLVNLGNSLDTVVGSRIPVQLQDSINLKGYYFVQNSIEGGLFVYNKTLLEEAGFDLKDSDESGLPDVFETWDQIYKASDKILKKTDMVFPLSFKDQESFYPFLTSGRWTLNFTKKGSDPGFETQEFRDGLVFIEAMSTHKMDKTLSKDMKAEDLPWQLDAAFYERRSAFSFITDFEMADKYEVSSNDEYVYAPFPEYMKHRMSPMGEVDGYIARKETKYPSAAAEVIRILRSGEGVSTYQSSVGKTPIYHRIHLDELTITDKRVIEKMRAYNFHDTPPVMALDNNPTKLARSLYKEVDFMPILRDLYDHKITVDEAQIKIVELANKWIEENDLTEDEKKALEAKKAEDEKELEAKKEKESKESDDEASSDDEAKNN